MTALLGKDILYVTNTKNDILYDNESKGLFIVIAGRWYTSPTLKGEWTYVASDALPSRFADIPAESEKGHLRVYIAGTDEAQEAILDAHIPETKAVLRSQATIDITYDGEPKFEAVTGTSMSYAVNTATPVLKIDDLYYAVDDGVWFTAASPQGPWKVADAVPDDVKEIPASSPVYNVKFVHIYESTPQIVYVGYTPGYTGSYIYGPTVVYGTGYYYRPWYGSHYYARPATWGYNISYSSFYGWGFGVSYGTGPFTFSIGFGFGHSRYRYHPWYGPPFYRPPYYRPPGYRPPGYRPPHRPDRPVHLPERPGTGRPGDGDRPATRPSTRPEGGTGPSTRPEGGAGPSTRPEGGTGPTTRPESGAGPSTRPEGGSRPATGQMPAAGTGSIRNNVYTDREGNVYRRGSEGNWQQRDGNNWTSPGNRPSTGAWAPSTRPSTGAGTPSTRPSQPAARPSTRPATRPSQQPSTGNWDGQRSRLERDYNSRQRSNQRDRSYQRQRSSRPSHYGSGGMNRSNMNRGGANRGNMNRGGGGGGRTRR
jgi:hypothetical protein